MKKPTEAELLFMLSEAELEYKEAQRKMDVAKKLYTYAETQLINTKLSLERVQENIRVYHATTYVKEHGAREKEIKTFQQDHPEVCDMAKQRDKDRP
jgi:hypothetical protein